MPREPPVTIALFPLSPRSTVASSPSGAGRAYPRTRSDRNRGVQGLVRPSSTTYLVEPARSKHARSGATSSLFSVERSQLLDASTPSHALLLLNRSGPSAFRPR